MDSAAVACEDSSVKDDALQLKLSIGCPAVTSVSYMPGTSNIVVGRDAGPCYYDPSIKLKTAESHSCEYTSFVAWAGTDDRARLIGASV